MWKRSYRKDGRLIPSRTHGLRAGAVTLTSGAVMDWHSTHEREELLISIAGRVSVECATSWRKTRRVLLQAGECLLLPHNTRHRVVNHGASPARYLYVTG